MIHNLFIGATWLIGILGVAGTAAAVAAVVFLGPAAFIGIVQPILVKFITCMKCVAVTVFVLATVGSYWVGRYGEYKRGHTAAIAEIAAEDAQTIASATEKRNVWSECKARNGQWDQSTGECK